MVSSVSWLWSTWVVWVVWGSTAASYCHKKGDLVTGIVVFFPQYTGRSEQCSSVYCPRAVITCVNRRNNNPSQKYREEMKHSQLSWTDSETRLGASEQDHTKGDPCSLLLFKTWAVKDTADGNWEQHPPTDLTKSAQLSTAPCYHKSLDPFGPFLCDLMVRTEFLTYNFQVHS